MVKTRFAVYYDVGPLTGCLRRAAGVVGVVKKIIILSRYDPRGRKEALWVKWQGEKQGSQVPLDSVEVLDVVSALGSLDEEEEKDETH